MKTKHTLTQTKKAELMGGPGSILTGHIGGEEIEIQTLSTPTNPWAIMDTLADMAGDTGADADKAKTLLREGFAINFLDDSASYVFTKNRWGEWSLTLSATIQNESQADARRRRDAKRAAIA